MPKLVVKDISVAYTEYGASTDLAVILLHAFPLRGAIWDDQASALAENTGARVVVPDLRGFGDSDAPPGLYPMDLLARDVFSLADALGIERLVLGGISMGGYVAFAALRLAPERIRGLILVDTRAGADSPETARSREDLAQLVEREGAAAAVPVQLPRLLSPAGQANPALAGRVSEMIAANAPAGIAGASRGMASRPDSTDLLPQIACPTLIIVGELDTTTPLAEARLMFERIPEARLAVIRNAAHITTLEAPLDVAIEMEHFVRSLREA
jgi:3-oxoadipate enol-lactonase